VKNFEIIQADVMQWCRDYDGPPFHAMLTDCPWELKFMSKKWDASGISFQPETWAALSEHLLPGAFIMVFAASRGWHRLACAIEDAGFLIQPSVFVEGVGVVDVTPMVLHVQAQSFPKATRIDTKLDAQSGVEREVIGRRVYADGTPAHMNKRNGHPGWDRPWMEGPDENKAALWDTAPATPLARAWAGHRYGGQILRDCATPIVVAQKPWTGKRLDCIVETGSGALNVEAARIGTNTIQTNRYRPGHDMTSFHGSQSGNKYVSSVHSGRWPPNYAVSHFSRTLPDGTIWGCIPVTETRPCPDCAGDGGNGRGCETCGDAGVVEVEANPGGIPSRDSDKNCKSAFTSTTYTSTAHHFDEDGCDSVARFACARHCPDCGAWWRSETATACLECGEGGEWACGVRRLDEQAGHLHPSGNTHKGLGRNGKSMFGIGEESHGQSTDYKDGGGGPSRFYPNPTYWAETAEALALGPVRKYQAKPSPREKSAGLERFVWRKRKSGHTRIWSDAAIDEFYRWQEERKGIPGEGFDKWLEACGESKRKIHRIPYTWGNIHPTVKSIALDIWLCRLLACPPMYAPRRLLVPFLGSGTEMAAAILSGQWEHITGIDSDEQTCWQAEARAKFWHGWSERTGEWEPKAILKAYRVCKKASEMVDEYLEAEKAQPQQAAMSLANG